MFSASLSFSSQSSYEGFFAALELTFARKGRGLFFFAATVFFGFGFTNISMSLAFYRARFDASPLAKRIVRDCFRDGEFEEFHSRLAALDHDAVRPSLSTPSIARTERPGR
jgi:hypothetical protein